MEEPRTVRQAVCVKSGSHKSVSCACVQW